MRAHEYAPVKRLDLAPSRGLGYVARGQREEALSDALRGIELGAYDERIRDWMVMFIDEPTLKTVMSWLERARAEGAREVRERSSVPGNSGPGY